MPDDTVMHGYDVPHPAPHASAVAGWMLVVGLFAAPLAWTVQLLVSYASASLVCYPREHPFPAPPPGSGWLWPSLIAVNVLAVLAAGFGTVVAYRAWRRSGGEASGGHDRLLEAGEGRTRYLAVCGFWSGIWFLIAIAFDTIAVFGVPLCGR